MEDNKRVSPKGSPSANKKGMELDTNEDMAIQKELERIRIRIQTMITTHPHLNRRERFPKKGGMRVKT